MHDDRKLTVYTTQTQWMIISLRTAISALETTIECIPLWDQQMIWGDWSTWGKVTLSKGEGGFYVGQNLMVTPEKVRFLIGGWHWQNVFADRICTNFSCHGSFVCNIISLHMHCVVIQYVYSSFMPCFSFLIPLPLQHRLWVIAHICTCTVPKLWEQCLGLHSSSKQSSFLILLLD